ncbi:MAG TPA: EAL domain-containing protein [Candidatus Manganitrophaceae bacterium]|nr:EAL domain-containing protein [Candidatus Manganitrophaceae bacterium]
MTHDEALKESSQLLQTVVHASPLAIIVIDREGIVRMWNPAAQRTFGWSEQEVLGSPLPIIPADRRKEFDANLEAVIQGKRFVNVALRHQRKDGALIDTHLSAALIRNPDGAVVGVMAFIADVTEQKRSEATIRRMAYYDSVTDLPNRASMRDRLQQAILAASYENQSACLLFINLDRFKEINNALGHHRGDALLQQVGPRLRTVLSQDDLIARVGGNEFAVLLPLADRKRATATAGEILKALEKPFLVEGVPMIVGCSIGIALSPDHGGNPDALFQRADIAMYFANENKTGYTVYSPEADQNSPRRLVLLGELQDAMRENELFLVYQPKIDLKSGRITGVESLARWNHPQYGVIPPDQFIPTAEHSGLIKPLTQWGAKIALDQCRSWDRAGRTLSMAINLSVRNLEDQQFPELMAEWIERSGVAPSQLELEITEGALMVNPRHAMEILTRLNKMGIRLSIDDFGTGYSSLAYLKKLPVHQLKIDKSFVIDMATNEEDAIIVRSTIELSHNLGLQVVAEGVETEEVLKRLVALGCDEAQGYYISRPVPPEELNRWLEKREPVKRGTAGFSGD